MQSISWLFNTLLYRPLLNVLILFYQYLPGHDFGIAVIILTVFIRILLYPLGVKAVKSQKAFQDIQSKIQEIQRKYKDEKEKQLQATIELYREAKINPFSGLLPLLIQLPVLIALYRLFWRGLNPEEMVNLYRFIPNPGQINPTFLGTINLSQSFFVKVGNQAEYYWPVLILAILAGILQFIQTKMLTPQTKGGEKQDKFSAILQKQTLYFFPIFTILILLRLPSALALYWVVTTIFSIAQQHFILKTYAKPT